MNTTSNPELEIDLTHYLEVVMRRRWIILSTLLIVFISTALHTFTVRPVYQASTLMVIEKERSAGGTIYANAAALVESSNEDYYQTQYKLLQSESLTQKVFDDLKLTQQPDFANPGGVQKFRGAITIFPVLRSRLVYVRVQSHDPELAARATNALAQTFVNQNLANQLFISKEVLQALQISEDSLQARQTYEGLPAVVNNPLVQTLKGEYAKLEAQFAEMSQRFTPKYPAMIALKSHMAALKGQIQAETDKIVQSLKTELSGQLKGNNVRIIDPAQTPKSPIKPNKRRNLLLGLLGGLALGLSIALIIETIDQTVRTQEDVENKLQLPFLGLIPLSHQTGTTIYQSLLAKELSLTSEAMRNLRTMIDFAGVSQKSKAMLVTSTIQSEGKTYVASNLAVVFAQLGESVLLIDGDLRRASLHKVFGVSSRRGLSDFLASGENVSELSALLQPSEVPNLQILSCGPRPPNPSELLNTPRLEALISWAKTEFDRIIVDCTPMFPINDTLLWGRHIPATAFIVRYGKTRTPLIRNACQKLQTGGMKILGVAVNLAKPGGLAYASYGYYYHQYYHAYHQEAVAGKTS
ncbi:MAG: polysaccharide biosynthesis tyrosine autokinase [Elusimicrobia bacterium]|nr:polysaccharide biosynthesis tyrosine autokinase [Candidatus Obscuribacterium magneticum]